MPYKFNPFTGTFDDSTTGPQGPAGTVSAAGSGTAAAPGIAFSADLNTGIYNPSADNLAISTGGTGRLFIDANGNVGVSDSSPSTNSIGAGAPTMVLRGTSGAQPTRSAGLCFISQDGTSKTLQYHDNNIFYTQSTTATAQAWFTNNLERMRLTSAGLLGLGTSSPSFTAHVSGAKNTTQLFVAAPTISAVNDFTQIGFGLSTTAFGVIRLGFDNPSAVSNSYFSFFNDNGSGLQERLRIDSSGRVGIGTTSPVAFLHVSGSGASSCRLTDTQSYNFGTSGPTLDLTGNDSSGANTLFVRLKGSPNNGNPDRGFLDILTRVDGITTSTLQVGTGLAANVLIPNGRVGIGTASPSYKLEVGGTLGNFGVADNGCELFFTRNANNNINASGGSATLNYNAGAGHIYAVGGTERARIDSSGNFGVGVISPATASFGNVIRNKAPSGTGAAGYFTEGANSDTWFGIYSGTGTSDSAALLYPSTGSLRIATTTGVGVGGFSERLRIDSSGRLLVGTSTARGNFLNTTGQETIFQVEGTSNNNSRVSFTRNSADDNSSLLLFGKTRSTSVGGNTVVQNNDSLGGVLFLGSDGTELVQAANIVAFVDGTPGADDMPGRLVFSTTADGAATPSERMRITSAGRVGIGTVSPGSALEVNAAAATSPFIAKINTTEVARVDSSGRVLVGAASSDTALVDASVQSVPPANTPALGLLRSATVAGNTTATILTTANTSSAFLVVGIRGNAGSKTFLCHRGSSTVTEIATAGTFDGSLAWSTNNLQGTSTSASSTVWSIIAFA
jgi:hypothetical protein